MHKITCLDAKDNPRDFEVSDLTWRPSVYGIVIKDDSVLLLPEYEDGFDFPGGAIELGESIHDALVREVKEETGLTIDVGELIAVRESFFYSQHGNQKAYQSLLFYYVCHNPRGVLSTSGFHGYEKEFAELARWVSLSEIDSINFYNGINESAELIRLVVSKV